MTDLEQKPRLRFKGFTEAWEQRKLNEIVSYTSSSLSAKDAIDDGKWDLYDVNQLIGKTNLFFVKDDYITIIKDGAGVGRVRLLPKNSAFIGTMGALLPFNSDLLFDYALLTKANLSSKFSGSTIPHIYFKDYGNEIYGVSSLLEQEKIGNLFNQLDSLITLHQRKYEKLKSMKTALLEKMFPAGNDTAPKIRFKGFTEAWEQRKVGDILKSVSVDICEAPNESGKYEVIQQGNVPVAGYTDLEPYKEYQRIVLFGDHTLSIYKPKNPFLVASDGVKAYYIQNVEGNYFAYLLERNLPANEGYKRYSSILKDKEINLTFDKKEEIKIGVLLDNLDSLITLHQRKRYVKLTKP